jgi:hypothetical protein
MFLLTVFRLRSLPVTERLKREFKAVLAKSFACIVALNVVEAAPARGRLGRISLHGAIDIHAHQDPDSTSHVMDAVQLARIAKRRGMRGLVLKSHWQPTASLAYMARKMVPGIELFGGVTQDVAVGGINVEAVRRMADTTGGYGRVVWLPTLDAANEDNRRGVIAPPELYAFAPRTGGRLKVEVASAGKLLPEVIDLIDYVARHPPLVLETGHISAQESLLVIREARARGVAHIVVTHAINPPEDMTIEQMKEAAAAGAFIEFTYAAVLERNATVSLTRIAEAMRAVGPAHCIMATDLGGYRAGAAVRPSEPQGFLDFMVSLNRLGFSIEDLDLMAKENPAIVLGLTPPNLGKRRSR